MGHQLIKTARDRDQYLLWSSVTDSWLLLGTRAEMLEELPTVRGWDQENAELALDRADKHGTSAPLNLGCPWDDDYLAVGECAPRGGSYRIARDRLPTYADAILRGDGQAAQALLERYDEDEDDD